MRRFDRISKLRTDARGATAIEYGLLVAMIAMGLMGGAAAVGGANERGWAAMTAKVNAALEQ